jgi:prepilin-type N-terminal cleavage/methylation domain-containing protein
MDKHLKFEISNLRSTAAPSASDACAPLAAHRKSQIANRKCFTLVELVTTLAVISILAAGATPRFANYIRNDRLRRSAARLAMDVRLAQTEAIKTQRYVTVQYNVGKSVYQTIYSSDGATVPTTGIVYVGRDRPYRATLVSADFAGDPEAVFDRFGVPRAAGSVVLGLDDIQVTVTLDPTSGRVTTSALTRVFTKVAAPSPENQAITFPTRKFVAPSAP